MKRTALHAVFCLAWLTIAAGMPVAPVAAQRLAPAPIVLPTERTVLPIPEPEHPHSAVLDVRNATPPPRFEVRAPQGAPNVLIVLLDDMGFGQPSTFGGPIHMPTLDRLASQGLRYNQFHTTALCSPTRAALLTGRNHHMCNMGAVVEMATAFPGQTCQRPNRVAPLAEMLRLNGFATAAFGKSHETAAWEVSPSGPTDRWPTRCGFDKFYGFIGGEANQWAPLLYDGMNHVVPPRDPHYHLMTDITNQAIAWVKCVKSLTPDKPFFLYFAPGATHAPHHVPKQWIAKYRGQFERGWDSLREETLARQKKLGIVPPQTELAPKPAAIRDWDRLTADEKKLFARQMEVYAGFGEYADAEIGRLVQAVEDLGQSENTLIFYIAGDNGASAEGGMNGLFNENSYFNGVRETVPEILKHYDALGSPMSYGHYAAGWAVAGDTPFTWTKQVASNFGGTRNGMVICWPKGIQGKGQLRSQFHHVIDVAPTILEATGLPEPKVVHGAPQVPIEGVSMAYTFADATAQGRHVTQYFEIFGNRAIYHDGWLAGTVHRAPWEPIPRATLENDKWELYHVENDFSLARDLAAEKPQKLHEMQTLFGKEAVRYNVLPIDDRTSDRFNAATSGRPDLMAGRKSLTVYEGMTGMSENVFISVKNRSHAITAEVEIPPGGADGVILCQGGRFGGWSLYFKGGIPMYTYNWLGLNRYRIAATAPVPAGKATLRFQFSYDGGKPGRGGTGTIFVHGSPVAQGRIQRTQPFVFWAGEGADVGMDLGFPVIDDYGIAEPYKFTGRIDKVTIDVDPLPAADQQAQDNAKRECDLRKALSD